MYWLYQWKFHGVHAHITKVSARSQERPKDIRYNTEVYGRALLLSLDFSPPEVWKTREFDNILLRHCNAVYNQNTIDRWTRECILPFPMKCDLRIAKNLRGITLTFIAAKIYKALLRNRIEPKIEKILSKNQNGFWRNRSTSQILTICRILECVRAKILDAKILFFDFS